MKVSKEKKHETRRKIVAAAADLFVEHGFDGCSMKQIAKEAGVGDATIYNYFPSKSKLISGFYDVRGADAIKSYKETEDLESYTFAEKLQLLIDTYLEQLVSDREFVQLSLKRFTNFRNGMSKDETSISKSYNKIFLELIEELEEQEGYAEVPMQQTMANLLTYYLTGIVLYWAKDDSEEFTNTTQLCDTSIQLIDSVLKSGVINRAMETGAFFAKNVVLNSMNKDGGFMSMLQKWIHNSKERSQSKGKCI